MSLWKKISLGVVIVILLLLGSVAFLVGTTSGLHLVFKAADRWDCQDWILARSPAAGDLTLSDVCYEQPGVAVKAGNLHLAVRLECLWNSSVCINDLALKDIQVNIDSKKMPPSEQVEEEEDSGPLDLLHAVSITLTRVALDNVNIKIDDTTVSVMDFHLRPELAGENPDPETDVAERPADCSAESGGSGARKKWSNRKLKIRSRRKSRSAKR
ncbi:hypothetical protein ACLB1E_01630 [Escherichia coli]